ncbi:DUF4811 domain-containing protein [Levilactobacillus sp. N40-8-2]|uniref:DUF4811 domain-containing protein n=1 Tax=Levilactobacillus muriae TaxID=3238987 RepID=UPI0038B41524
MLVLMMIILAGLAGWLFYTCRHGWGVVVVLIMLLGQGLLLLDASHHYGTQVVTTTATSKLIPVGSIRGNHILMTKAIKEGKTTYTAYASRAKDKTVVILNKHKRVNVNFNAQRHAVRITRNRRYRYTSIGMRWLFSGITNQNQLQRQTVTYRLTAHWHVMDKQAVKRTEKQLQRKSVQQQAKAYVAAKMATVLKRQPQLKSQQKQLQARYLRDYVSHILNRTE